MISHCRDVGNPSVASNVERSMRSLVGYLASGLLACAVGCASSGTSQAPSASTLPPDPLASVQTRLADGSTPAITADAGCGPDDRGLVTVRAVDVGPEDVLVQVLYEGTVYNASAPRPGPVVGEVFDPELPKDAYEAGSAEARVVRADDPSDTIVSTTFELDASCG